MRTALLSLLLFATPAHALNEGLQCVPFARALTGLEIRGDAHSWWDQAEGRYERGSRPKVGAVMTFIPHGNMRLGHVAAVRRIIDKRTLLISHADRSAEAVLRSLEVNALSSWRLLELFAGIANADPARAVARELWMNTSEAEIQAAVSPLYEISKRLQGQLLSLRSLDLAGPQLRLRRLVLGPFRSALNPIGVMSAGFVAREILRQVRGNWGLVIVTPNPLTYLLMPLACLSRWLYFQATSKRSAS